MIGRILVVALAFGAGVLATRTWLDTREASGSGDVPRVEQNDPGRGDPPVVWVSGTVTAITETRLDVREGEGPTVRMTRFAAGATSFHRLRGGEWREVPTEEVGSPVGRRVCVEALLDDGDVLALRVFLGAACSPRP